MTRKAGEAGRIADLTNGHAPHENGVHAAEAANAKDSLSQQQEKLVQQLHDAVANSIKDSVALQHFVTRSCCIRYLRARSWRLPQAIKMLQATLTWRRQYKPECITWEDIAPEAEQGKQFILPDLQRGGFARDSHGRPVLVLRPRNENTKTYDRQLKFVVYHLETASWMADQDDGQGDGKMAWLVDFVGYTYSSAPPVSSAVQTLRILQNHYPERLGVAISYLPPTIFSLTWKAIQPFMDPLTKSKIVFINNVKDVPNTLGRLVDLKDVEKCMSGHSEYEFDLQKYAEVRKYDDAIRQKGLL